MPASATDDGCIAPGIAASVRPTHGQTGPFRESRTRPRKRTPAVLVPAAWLRSLDRPGREDCPARTAGLQTLKTRELPTAQQPGTRRPGPLRLVVGITTTLRRIRGNPYVHGVIRAGNAGPGPTQNRTPPRSSLPGTVWGELQKLGHVELAVFNATNDGFLVGVLGGNGEDS